MTEPPPRTLPRVSIIIVTWNALPVLKRCLPSVVRTSYPNLQIVVADNGSTDGTVEWIRDAFPSVDVLAFDENYAFCGGNNRAIRHTDGEFLAFLNNDVEVTDQWLEPMIDRAMNDPQVAAIQPKLLQFEDRDRFEYAGAAGGFLDRLGYPFARGRMFRTLEIDAGQYDHALDLSWATGAALVVRRSALPPGDPFDERFFMHMEEIDLCWRLRRDGYRIVCDPRSTVYHMGGASLNESSPRKTYLNFRNNLFMVYKNTPPARWRRLLVFRVVLDLAAVLQAALTGRIRDAGAILRAHLDSARMRRNYRDRRPEPLEIEPGPYYDGSIVLDYFVLRRTLFSSLPQRRFRGKASGSRPRKRDDL